MPSANAIPHQTALHGAAARGFSSFVKYLAGRGADINARDADGQRRLQSSRF
jgi:ankyrin repeat protein